MPFQATRKAMALSPASRPSQASIVRPLRFFDIDESCWRPAGSAGRASYSSREISAP
jgi:hypothetical protein